MSSESIPMNHICPMCKQEMDVAGRCMKCDIIHWSLEELEELQSKNGDIFATEPWSKIHLNPIDQSYYYFFKHGKFYTVPEMERLTKLKAFL
jgi:hypothetical protein